VDAGLPIDVALPIVIAVMMLAVGMSLRIEDFRALASTPLPAAIGLTGMFVAFPLLAFALAAAYPLSPELRIGLVLVAASPSASTSTIFTYLARGDVALSVALTAVSKIVPVLTIPFYVGLAALAFAGERATVSLSFADTSESVALTVLLPTLAGMLLRHAFPSAASTARPHVTRVAVTALVLLIAVLAFRERHGLAGMFAAAGPAAFSLCVLGFAGAYGAAAAFRLTVPQRTAIGIEVSMQSGGTAIAIAAGLLGAAAMAVPAAVYSLIMYAFAGAYVAVRRTRLARDAVTSGSPL
jgi:bile acid:Na+ symporter, BASS family